MMKQRQYGYDKTTVRDQRASDFKEMRRDHHRRAKAEIPAKERILSVLVPYTCQQARGGCSRAQITLECFTDRLK